MPTVSEQLIKKYCVPVEERISACCDEKVAEFLKLNLCSEMKKHCKSDIVLGFFNKYVDNLIKTKFPTIKN